MIKQNITPQGVCDFLNELMTIDPTAINSLFNNRVTCNEALSDHETVQVGVVQGSQTQPGTVYQVGILGILNGMFGVNEHLYGCIVMVTNDGKTKQFQYEPNAGPGKKDIF